MEQHPVPQQISSYEFRLVGDMTLKQFALVAGGCLIALLFYASPLPGLFKWPLVILSAFAGAAFAFLPFEERPLQTWIIAFLKAIYSPTQFLWQKKGQKPVIFEEKGATQGAKPTTSLPTAPQKTTDYWSAFSSSWVISEKEEQKMLDRIQTLLTNLSQVFPQASGVPRPTFSPPPPPEPEKRPTPIPIPITIEKPPIWAEPSFRPSLPTHYPRRGRPRAESVHFFPKIPMPSVPTIPNVLVGMVFDLERKIVEGAIIEIRDSQGNSVRAFKTNKLGQFRTVTPLPNDIYEIEIEKEGLQFDLIKIEFKGEIVEPIEIKAKGVNQLTNP